jgi:hypothetical protein
MGRLSLQAPISSSSRRRLARWLVGSPIRVVERDLVLETLAHTHGNRTVSASLLDVSVRMLRNEITEYSAEGLDIPRHESRDEISRAERLLTFCKTRMTIVQSSSWSDCGGARPRTGCDRDWLVDAGG